MKKLIVLLAILSIFIIFKDDKIKPVSKLKHEIDFKLDDYNVFYLSFENELVTTKNIEQYITSDMDVISMSLYVNPIYSKEIGEFKYTFENNISNKQNIKNMTNYYKKVIESKKYLEDLTYIDIDGIKINEVMVFSKGSEIANLIYQNNLIKYKKVFYGEYKSFEV